MINTPLMTTVANIDAFIRDMAAQFNGQQDQTLNVTVTLKGSNVLEYSISKVPKKD